MPGRGRCFEQSRKHPNRKQPKQVALRCNNRTHLVIVGEFLETLQKGQVADPLVGTQASGDNAAQLRVALSEPAAGSDTVGDTDELVRDPAPLVILHKGREHVRLDQLRVDRRNAVNLPTPAWGLPLIVHTTATRLRTRSE